MADQSVHFSSASSEWQTPLWLFKRLDAEFHFDLDAAATKENALCERFYTAEMDALKQDWGKDATNAFTNPPYGRIGPKLVRKGFEECAKYPHLTAVFLTPARPDTRWWHDYCAKGEIRFLKGRLAFVNPTLPSYREDGQFETSPAPFPSAIVVFGARARAGQVFHVEYREGDPEPVETVTIPVIPPDSLLWSMGVRLNHAFGAQPEDISDEEIERMRNSPDVTEAVMGRQWMTSDERRAYMVSMAQVHEEVVGRGFYRYTGHSAA